jgi:MYXO-CTERM domain-containing protein
MTCTSPLGTYGVAQDSTGSKGTPTSSGAGGACGASGGGTTEPPRAAGTPGSSPSAGCALGGHPSSSLAGLAALALLGLAMARRRR